MTEGVMLFLASQTIALVVAMIGLAWRIGSRLTGIEVGQQSEKEKRRGIEKAQGR